MTGKNEQKEFEKVTFKEVIAIIMMVSLSGVFFHAFLSVFTGTTA